MWVAPALIMLYATFGVGTFSSPNWLPPPIHVAVSSLDWIMHTRSAPGFESIMTTGVGVGGWVGPGDGNGVGNGDGKGVGAGDGNGVGAGDGKGVGAGVGDGVGHCSWSSVSTLWGEEAGDDEGGEGVQKTGREYLMTKWSSIPCRRSCCPGCRRTPRAGSG